MATSKTTEYAPVALDSQTVLHVDEFAGIGGSYIFDPLTGKRTPQTEQQTEER
jgi:hypothetical protein